MNIEKTQFLNRAHHSGHNGKTASEETQKKPTTLAADNTDKFDPNTTTYKNTYNRPAHRTENNRINDEDFGRKAGKSSLQLKNDAVRDMVQGQVSTQAKKGAPYRPAFGAHPDILSALQTAEATSAKHADYWGVEATAERLFTFASTLAGDNPAALEAMRTAFLKGFQQAAGAWSGAGGGKLPSVSYQTRDRVLQMFDERMNHLMERNPGHIVTSGWEGNWTTKDFSQFIFKRNPRRFIKTAGIVLF